MQEKKLEYLFLITEIKMIEKLRKHQSIDINRRINLPKKKKKNFKNLSKGQLLPIKKKVAQLIDLSSL